MTPDTIVAVLAHNAEAAPDRPACIFRDREGRESTVSRGRLWQRSAAFAARLTADGVQPGETYLIAVRQNEQALCAFLGAMIAGAVPAFMPFPTVKQNADLFWSSHRELFALVGARHFLTYRANDRMQEVIPPGAILRHMEDVADWFEAPPGQPSMPLAAMPAPHAVALLQHSSGTTGLKKGVMLSHAAILTQVRHYATAIGFGPDDVIASWLPLYHDMGLIACFMMPILVGAPVIMLDPFEWVGTPTVLLDCIGQHRATFCWMPNFAFQHLVRTAPPGRQWDLSSMKAFVNCSEPCKPEAFALFHERFAASGLRPDALQVSYAMAENVFAVTQTAPGAPPRIIDIDIETMETEARVAPPVGAGRAMVSCGPPLAETEIMILDPGGQPAAAARIGQIAIRSACLFDGYNRLPELTREKLVDGWYHTGDLGFLEGGELFVTGRQDDLMIVYGRNYYAHAIEQVASLCPGVVPGRVVAFAVENVASGSRDAVLLVESDGSRTEAEMRRQIKTYVFDTTGLLLHAVRVHSRGTLVKSTAGKISRSYNKALHEQRQASG